jgi:hypothetical protein
VFHTAGVPRNPFEKIADAAQVNAVTGLAPRVSLHIPWDKVDDFGALATLLIVWLNAGILLAFVGNDGAQYQLLALGTVLIFAALLNGLTIRRYGGSR